MKKFLLLLTLMAANTGGCKAQVHHDPPQTIGERTNSQGVVTQRIILESSYTTDRVPVLTPDGLRNRTHGSATYYLEEDGKPRREFPIMFSVNATAKNYEKCWPVEGTNQWLAAGIDPIGNRDKLYFVLFDESRIVRTNVFSVVPKWKSEKAEYELQNGNRTMIIRTPDGLQKYDVLADKSTKVEK
jgi:hypothetical protein